MLVRFGRYFSKMVENIGTVLLSCSVASIQVQFSTIRFYHKFIPGKGINKKKSNLWRITGILCIILVLIQQTFLGKAIQLACFLIKQSLVFLLFIKYLMKMWQNKRCEMFYNKLNKKLGENRKSQNCRHKRSYNCFLFNFFVRWFYLCQLHVQFNMISFNSTN